VRSFYDDEYFDSEYFDDDEDFGFDDEDEYDY
jgi:hypothetical protein